MPLSRATRGQFVQREVWTCGRNVGLRRLRKGNARFEAIQFNFGSQPGNRARAAYRLAINEYMGVETPQLMIEYLE